MNAISKLAATAALLTFSASAIASGTESYGGTYKKVDRLYEEGKANYYATDSSGQRARYCVKTEDALEKVSRKSLKSFAGTSAAELSSNLVRCEQPDAALASIMGDDQASALMYYLNKRYRLNLYGS